MKGKAEIMIVRLVLGFKYAIIGVAVYLLVYIVLDKTVLRHPSEVEHDRRMVCVQTCRDIPDFELCFDKCSGGDTEKRTGTKPPEFPQAR